MALSNEELLLQMNILASKTDEKTNANMVYNTIAALNKGLNPEVFSGNNTKIVNAINLIASMAGNAETMVTNLIAKTNDILMETADDNGKAIWEHVKELMEQPTIIQGLQRMLEGKQQDKLLGITPEDVGKILTVDQAEDGEMMVKAIDNILNGEAIVYQNEEHPEITNMSQAIDKLFEVSKMHLEVVTWENIVDKPEVVTGIELIDNKLVLIDEDEDEVDSIDITTDEDIENIISDL